MILLPGLPHQIGEREPRKNQERTGLIHQGGFLWVLLGLDVLSNGGIYVWQPMSPVGSGIVAGAIVRFNPLTRCHSDNNVSRNAAAGAPAAARCASKT